MSRFVHRWHRLLTWLGLCALLLMFAGPLISQFQRLLEMPTTAAMSSHAHGEAMAHYSAAADAMPSHYGEVTACDYCTLFLHMPGIAPPLALPDIGPSQEGRVESVSPSPPPPEQHYPFYIGRAPPRMSSLPFSPLSFARSA
ncbi:hypothetical protein L861_13790 [Litchfieldella anticariensis FP35 = DSM 16096]|uniref:DUF2946 domain-containing protein n=1 Tax=Litchfieldella anticariensis (strain DSM 16096 / CECT 5854 / CIP 108499 / LMG 22089 / FP35) TaxID=1121939 RepID=S2KFG1_LITA3|nr:DUF2946 domain-containing protein [Halomonas anticariensis]EPC00857.1 hypothetical protein L861_13790 [Halomonas anticariensis FP35 = DSM 16096]